MTIDEALDIILDLAKRGMTHEVAYLPRVHEAFEIVDQLKSKPVIDKPMSDLERRLAYFEQCIASFKGDMS